MRTGMCTNNDTIIPRLLCTGECILFLFFLFPFLFLSSDPLAPILHSN